MAARPDSGTHRRIVGFTRREWQSTLYFLLHNFTTRYVAADPARTGAFLNMFAIAHMILSTAVIAFRADRILPPRDEEGASRHG